MLTRRAFVGAIGGASSLALAGSLLLEQGGTEAMVGVDDTSSPIEPPQNDFKIDTAQIEPCGWVLAVTGRWNASTLSMFALDPNSVPKVVVTVRSRGHERLSGRVVAAAKLRQVVATKPLRVSVPGPPMDLKSLDEVHVDGLRTVRLALSDQVHLGDEVLEVRFAAGWRLDMPAEQKLAANNSLQLVELPTMQWIVPSLMRATRSDDIRLDMLVASGWAEALDAVAGVRFSATDGISTNEQWRFSESPSSGWGDELLCWGLMASVLCEGLNPGPVTVHAEIFPWIGQARSTGTRHSTDRLASFAPSAERPLHVIWDPDGLHMPAAHVYVDRTRGSVRPAEVTVAGSLAAARAGVPAATPSIAAQALFLASRTIPGANGFPASTRAGDNGIITLSPGLHDFGTQAVSLGASTAQGRMVLQGDPDFADGTEPSVLSTGLRPTWRYSSMLLRNFRLLIGGTTLPFSAAAVHMQGLEVTARPGFEASQAGLFSSTAARFTATIAGSRWHKTAVALRGTSMSLGFVRSSKVSRSICAPVIVGVDRIDEGNDSFILYTSTTAGPDQIMWGNKVWAARTTMLSLAGIPSNTSASSTLTRFRMVNNLCEMAGPRNGFFSGIGKPPIGRNIGSVGEGVHLSAIDCLVEGNSFIGQRFSWGYNDPPSIDPALQNRHRGNHFRNNYTDRSATKHDNFHDATHGLRPGFTECWSILYGVGHADNVLGLRWGNVDDFEFEFDGLGIVRSPYPGFAQANQWTRFLDDRSQFSLSSNQAGFGDYTPGIASPLREVCHRANTAADAFGRPRSARFAAGCREGLTN